MHAHLFLKSELKVKIMGNPQNYRATRCHKRGDLRRLATTLNLFINKMSMAILSESICVSFSNRFDR